MFVGCEERRAFSKRARVLVRFGESESEGIFAPPHGAASERGDCVYCHIPIEVGNSCRAVACRVGVNFTW